MKPDIEAIFIDLGNTMRILVKDAEHQSMPGKKLLSWLDHTNPLRHYANALMNAIKCIENGLSKPWIEAPESELWTRWLLPDYPAEKLAPDR